MKKFTLLIIVTIYFLVGCIHRVTEAPILIPILTTTGAPIPSDTTINTRTPSPSKTFTPTSVSAIPSPIPTQTSPGSQTRPDYLFWPLPSYIGVARISQFPDTPWTWNYLGLNQGYACPPMFGYLLNLDSLIYWRDYSIPEVQDKAQADPHQFEMVECYSSHAGTDIKAPAGTPVFAAAGGKVQEWSVIGLNSMVVLKHCLGGTWNSEDQCVDGKKWFTTYMHINPEQSILQENVDVKQGMQLGTIYDQTINSHLHFEVGLDKRGSGNYVNPWGKDELPWLECMWHDQSICINPALDQKRIAFITIDGGIFMKQAAIDDPVEIMGIQDLRQIRLWGDRIAVLDSKNKLLILTWTYSEQSINDNIANFSVVAENVLDFQITDQRVVILDVERNLWMKENEFENEWTLLARNVKSFSISEHRIGYLADDGNMFVNEGELVSGWTRLRDNVLAFQVIDSRIGYVDLYGDLSVNEGVVDSEFELMASNVKAFQITDVRLGVIDANNNLLVKEGNLRADWLVQLGDVKAFQLTGYRMIALGEDGVYRFKEGDIFMDWDDLSFVELKGVSLNGDASVKIP